MIRTLYLQSLPSFPRVQWKPLIFSNTARPKARFTLWLHLHGRLLTVERLSKWGIQINPKCSLCQLYDETLEHCFVYCHFSKSLWRRLLEWLQRPMMTATNWEQYMTWAIANSKGKSVAAHAFKVILVECVHSIWVERNSRIFEGRATAW